MPPVLGNKLNLAQIIVAPASVTAQANVKVYFFLSGFLYGVCEPALGASGFITCSR